MWRSPRDAYFVSGTAGSPIASLVERLGPAHGLHHRGLHLQAERGLPAVEDGESQVRAPAPEVLRGDRRELLRVAEKERAACGTVCDRGERVGERGAAG